MFYEGAYNDFITGTWDDFVVKIFSAALLVKWEDKSYEKIQHVKMSPFEDFKLYSARARSIQNLINYNVVNLSDNQLAKYVKYGMIEEFKATVQLWDLSDDSPGFRYQAFEHCCEKIYTSMVASKQIIRRSKGVATTTQNTTIHQTRTTPRLTDDEFVWKIHSYLDSVGKCHYCKGYCGSAY